MPELDPVRQDIEANALEYLAALDDMIAKAEEWAAVATRMEEQLAKIGIAADDAGANIELLAGRMNDARDAAAGMGGSADAAAARLNDLRNSAATLAGADAALVQATVRVDDALDDQMISAGAAARQLNDLRNAAGGAALADGALVGAAAAAAAAQKAQAAATGATAGTTAAAGGIIARWWAQWGAVVHWVVMGTLEIAATAIPAMVALGLAAAAMAPAFAHIMDQMNYLRAATGSWTGVLVNSVGPLRAMAQAGYNLRQAVAPDAYIIFGAAINSITGHVGAFSQIAQQASNVLAQFATKMSTALSGPLGGQLVSFFANSVRFMTQWGQVLGNLGHIFTNVMAAFWGTSHVLLTVLVDITNVLVALTSNPVIGWLIGLAGAMSAVYRWGRLLYNAFAWMGGDAAFAGIRAAITWVRDLAATFAILAEDIGVADAAMALLEASVPTLTALFFIVAAAMAIWATVQERTKTTTDNLIASINKMSPTVSNLGLGMQLMEGNLLGLASKFGGLDKSVTQSYSHMGRFGTAVDNANRPLAQNAAAVEKSITEMKKLAGETINLVTGLTQAGARTGQVGADMNAMAIQTAIADSKIQSVNQALDQYIGLLTGATSGNADFITSMANIGTVSATTRNNLGTNTAQLSLSATQFGNALTRMGTVGAAAWQNFDQVLSGSMQPMMDTLRQLGVTGALTGHQISTAAVDMAVQLGHFAGSNKTAQAAVMGFLRAQGLSFPSFHKFMQDATRAGAGQKQLNGIVNAGTIAFSKLSQMAKNAATAMNPMVVQAIDASALSASGFNTHLSKLQTDMQNHAPSATIVADMATVNSSYQTAIKMAEQTGNSITTNATKASSGVHQSTQQMAQAWDTGKLKQLSLQNQVQNSSQSIGTSTHGAASQVQSAMGTMGSAFQHAQQKATYLQQYIDQMHGKTINVNTVFSTSGSPANTPGLPAKASGGLIGGHGTGTSDSNLIRASRGEYMMNAAAVDHYGLAVMEAMNAKRYASGGIVSGSPSPSVLTATISGGGGGVTQANLNIRSELRIGQQELGAVTRKESLTFNRRNIGNNLSLLRR